MILYNYICIESINIDILADISELWTLVRYACNSKSVHLYTLQQKLGFSFCMKKYSVVAGFAKISKGYDVSLIVVFESMTSRGMVLLGTQK